VADREPDLPALAPASPGLPLPVEVALVDGLEPGCAGPLLANGPAPVVVDDHVEGHRRAEAGSPQAPEHVLVLVLGVGEGLVEPSHAVVEVAPREQDHAPELVREVPVAVPGPDRPVQGPEVSLPAWPGGTAGGPAGFRG
jgi:hypothetical protein